MPSPVPALHPGGGGVLIRPEETIGDLVIEDLADLTTGLPMLSVRMIPVGRPPRSGPLKLSAV
jgi:hypothetical protein